MCQEEGARVRRWGAKVLAGGVAAVVLLGTLAWAVAFVQIYAEPVTRVQATRWMYENIEAGATLYFRTADGETGKLQVPYRRPMYIPRMGSGSQLRSLCPVMWSPSKWS